MLAITGLFFAGEAQATQPYPPVGEAWSVEASGEQDVALVVAVEDYFRLPNVPGARETGRDWERFFRDGIGVGRVYSLIDDEVTREALERFARQAAEDVGEGGTLWFVFIGHGAPAGDGDEGLLLGVDAQQTVESIKARSLSQGEILRVLETGSQSRTVAFVDACFSGRDSVGASLVPNLQPVIPVEYIPQVREGSVVLSAARSNEYAGTLPGLDRPAFSYWMLGALRGWAAPEDGEARSVSAADALAFTRDKLRAIPGRVQTPVGVGDLDLVLVNQVQEADPLPNWNGRAPDRAVMGGLVAKPASEAAIIGQQTPPARRSGGIGTLRPSRFSVNFFGDWAVEDRELGQRYVGAEIYRMLGEEELAKSFEQASRRRARGVTSSRIVAWSGAGVAVAGVTMAIIGMRRELPEGHQAFDACSFEGFPQVEHNCMVQTSYDEFRTLRVGGWIAAGVGTAAFLGGQIMRAIVAKRSIHPRTPEQMRRMIDEKAKTLSLEINPYYIPGQDSQAGVTVGMQW